MVHYRKVELLNVIEKSSHCAPAILLGAPVQDSVGFQDDD